MIELTKEKCWKKTVDNRDTTTWHKLREFGNLDIRTTVTIDMPSSPFTHDDKIHVKTSDRYGRTSDRIFKTKEKANTFAQKYMKDHDRC